MIRGIINTAKFVIRRATGHGYYVNIKQVQKQLDEALAGKRGELELYGLKQGTDKASAISFMTQDEDVSMRVAHDYLRHYEFLFNNFKFDEFSLIEFGCADGASLRMWEEYFPKADIYGVDLDENATRHDNSSSATGGGGENPYRYRRCNFSAHI